MSPAHGFFQDYIHRPQKQVRGHLAALTHASVDPEPLRCQPIHADRAHYVRVLELHEVDDLLWHSMGPQQAPDCILIHRVESRPQVHVRSYPKRLTIFHPYLHDEIQREYSVDGRSPRREDTLLPTSQQL